MGRYLMKRLASAVLTVWFVLTLTFFLMNLMPGSPFSSDEYLIPEVRAVVEEKYGLNEPVTGRYIQYVKNILHGVRRVLYEKRNLHQSDHFHGVSLFRQNRPVRGRAGADGRRLLRNPGGGISKKLCGLRHYVRGGAGLHHTKFCILYLIFIYFQQTAGLGCLPTGQRAGGAISGRYL